MRYSPQVFPSSVVSPVYSSVSRRFITAGTPPGTIKVNHGVTAAGHHAHQTFDSPGDAVEVIQRESQPQLLAVRQQVEHCVGGAGYGQIQHHCIEKNLPAH